MRKIKWLGGCKPTKEDVEAVGGDWEKTEQRYKNLDYMYICSGEITKDGWEGWAVWPTDTDEIAPNTRFNYLIKKGYQDVTNTKEENPVESTEKTVEDLIKILKRVDLSAKVTIYGEPFSTGYLSYDLIENTLDIGRL